MENFDHRFQRTDQWKPVYSWLETLDTDEVVKSKEIIDWLTENSDVREQLNSRHSRYHLMHYIKKCHMKILKRKEKKKGPGFTKNLSVSEVKKSEDVKKFVPLQTADTEKLTRFSQIWNDMYHLREGTTGMGGFIKHGLGHGECFVHFTDCNVNTAIPKDTELYKAKQTEALQKYEILVELEKQLSMHLPKPGNTGNIGN